MCCTAARRLVVSGPSSRSNEPQGAGTNEPDKSGPRCCLRCLQQRRSSAASHEWPRCRADLPTGRAGASSHSEARTLSRGRRPLYCTSFSDLCNCPCNPSPSTSSAPPPLIQTNYRTPAVPAPPSRVERLGCEWGPGFVALQKAEVVVVALQDCAANGRAQSSGEPQQHKPHLRWSDCISTTWWRGSC